MSKEEKAALNHEAAEFVRKIVTEVYGQRTSKKQLNATAKRVAATVISAKSA